MNLNDELQQALDFLQHQMKAVQDGAPARALDEAIAGAHRALQDADISFDSSRSPIVSFDPGLYNITLAAVRQAESLVALEK